MYVAYAATRQHSRWGFFSSLIVFSREPHLIGAPYGAGIDPGKMVTPGLTDRSAVRSGGTGLPNHKEVKQR